MKFRTKLILFMTGFVVVFTVVSVLFISTYLIQHRLDDAIENAVQETKQVKHLIGNEIIEDVSQIYAHNRQGEYYELINESSSEVIFKRVHYNNFYYIEAFVPIELLGQTLRGRFDVTYLIEEQKYVSTFSLFLVVVIIIVAIISSMMFASNLTKPIEKLVKASKQVKSGAYNSRVENISNDEIGVLSKYFNEMAEQTELHVNQLNKVALKDRKLFSSLTHEINTPLTSIMGYSELLLSESLDAETIHKSLLRINDEGKKLSKLSEILLSLSNRKITRKVCMISSLIEESIQTCKSSTQKDIKFVVAGDLEVCVDPDLMKTVFSNLINNSIDAISEKGLIECIIKDDSIAIKDNGHGITSDTIFEPFSKGNEDNKHLGLGLTLVKDIIDLHGDTLEVTSDRGTVVIIHFSTSLQLQNNSVQSFDYDESKEVLR